MYGLSPTNLEFVMGIDSFIKAAKSYVVPTPKDEV